MTWALAYQTIPARTTIAGDAFTTEYAASSRRIQIGNLRTASGSACGVAKRIVTVILFFLDYSSLLDRRSDAMHPLCLLRGINAPRVAARIADIVAVEEIL
jgi:hypothetical protein